MLSSLSVRLLLSFLFVASAGAREFTVLVYNVENLFDLDGVAVFRDYRQDPGETERPYQPRHLLTKVRHIAEVLATIDEGAGPDVILFQEIELDRTPFSDGGSPEEFLEKYKRLSLEAMLTTRFSPEIAGLPAELILLKALVEAGMRPYAIAKPDGFRNGRPSAHTNVVFSRFPIRSVEQRSMASARDLLIVTLDVEGHSLIVMNNHWKAGASNATTEPARIQNAHVLRAELSAILLEDPAADVIVAGDFNSYYNHAALFPELPRAGLTDVLGSATDEPALIAGTVDVYNLWGELPPEERGSEVWRGEWGTLMQVLITRGLYDQAGVQYVDNSFFRLMLPGRNVDPRFGTPRAWVQLGNGAGFSDHLPIGARFRVVSGNNRNAFKSLVQPTIEPVPSALRLPVDYTLHDREGIRSADGLEHKSLTELAEAHGEVFRIEGRLEGVGGRAVRIGERTYGLFAAPLSLRERIAEMPEGTPIDAYGQLGQFYGNIQFVIQQADWMLAPDN